MNIRPLLISLVLLLPFVTSAQSFHLGVKTGLNFGYIDGKHGDDFYGLVNVHAGVVASKDFGPLLGIQAEAIINTLSTTVYEEIFIPNAYLNPQKATLSYLSLPLLLRINLSKRISFQTGPQYSTLFGSNKRLTNTETDAFKNGNFSLVFGLQAKTGKRWLFYGRYNAGLSGTGYNPTGGYYNNRDKSSFVIQAGVGYLIF